MPVGPPPMISTVSSSVISDILAAQKPVASTSPTKRACSSLTDVYKRQIRDLILNSMDQPQIIMSSDMEEAMKGLRRWMFEHVYRNDIPKAEESKAQEMIARLYEYYMKHADRLPMEYILLMVNGEKKSRVVCDYIAGMSDIYAIDRFEALFVPKRWNVY